MSERASGKKKEPKQRNRQSSSRDNSISSKKSLKKWKINSEQAKRHSTNSKNSSQRKTQKEKRKKDWRWLSSAKKEKKSNIEGCSRRSRVSLEFRSQLLDKPTLKKSPFKLNFREILSKVSRETLRLKLAATPSWASWATHQLLTYAVVSLVFHKTPKESRNPTSRLMTTSGS